MLSIESHFILVKILMHFTLWLGIKNDQKLSKHVGCCESVEKHKKTHEPSGECC